MDLSSPSLDQGKGSESSPLTELTLFSSLPTEIRLQIWDEATRPPIPGIQHFSDILPYQQKTIPAAVLDSMTAAECPEKETSPARLFAPRRGPIKWGLPGFYHHWVHDNPSLYLRDGGLWTACHESREVMTVHYDKLARTLGGPVSTFYIRLEKGGEPWYLSVCARDIFYHHAWSWDESRPRFQLGTSPSRLPFRGGGLRAVNMLWWSEKAIKDDKVLERFFWKQQERPLDVDFTCWLVEPRWPAHLRQRPDLAEVLSQPEVWEGAENNHDGKMTAMATDGWGRIIVNLEKVPGKRHLLTRLVYKSQSRLVLGKPDAELEMVPMAGLSKSTVDCVIAASVDLSTKRI